MSDVTTELAMEASEKAMEIVRLKAENDRLQNDADLLRAMLSQVQAEKRCYMADNAKLRELVADMWFWHYEGHIDSESQERQMLHIDAVIQRMRELGVVVNG